ncbi:hypothetical protein VNO77_22572 [Canavalia gladiata]|uniref:Uncharacterized protein n=1 Tax=Canavalia gladiata TaxID=3824 RepID=A0AAN9L2U8_CANGL
MLELLSLITVLSVRLVRDLTSEKDNEFVALKKQVEELEMKILEKDEVIELAEITKKQMNALKEKLEELQHQTLEKDSLLKSARQQLYDVKWETMTCYKKVEKMQEELDSMQGDILSFTLLLEGLIKPDIGEYTDDYDIKPYDFYHLPSIE